MVAKELLHLLVARHGDRVIDTGIVDERHGALVQLDESVPKRLLDLLVLGGVVRTHLGAQAQPHRGESQGALVCLA